MKLALHMVMFALVASMVGCAANADDGASEIGTASAAISVEPTVPTCQEHLASSCPTSGAYKTHGAYVTCVEAVTVICISHGVVTEAEALAIVDAAAQSDIGKK
jgi:hypothetical protein